MIKVTIALVIFLTLNFESGNFHLWGGQGGAAQDAEFTASVSKNPVASGERFQLTYSLNASGSNFRAPDMSAFSVLSGPNQSTSMQWINGSFSQSVSYSYYLVAGKEGKYTIGPAQITVNGKTLKSNSIDIEVIKGAAPPPQQQQSRQQPGQQQQNSSPAEAQSPSADKIFLTASVDKTKVYQGEQLSVSFKIYFRVNIVDNSVKKLPELNGFWTEDVKMPQQAQISAETVNGIKYNVAILKKTILFPQKSGMLEIDPMEFECVVRTNRQPSNFWDWPFGGYQDLKYSIRSKPVKITILPLPASGKPTGFTDAVGNFSLSATIDKTEVKTNEAVTLKFVFSGRGNLKLVDKPALVFPPDIENYDPKITDKTSVTSGGVSGSKSYEYILIPRHAGEYDIPSYGFSYFDPEKSSYIALSSPAFHIKVAKGAESPNITFSSVAKEDVKFIGSDIRFIKTVNTGLKQATHFFFLSPLFYALAGSPFFLFLLFVTIRKRQIEQNKDILLVKRRRATKMAGKRLSKSHQFIKENKQDGFYDETLRALWGYISDRLNIPVAELSKENVSAALVSRNVSEDTVKKFIQLLDSCEFSRYAPSSGAQSMDEIYREAKNIISVIEGELK